MEGDGEATLLIYGFIGNKPYYEDNKEEDLTDLEFVKSFKALEAKYDRINVRINSPGGLMSHGMAMVNTIRNSKSEVHTYVDGIAASMAADIWLAGDIRHMNSTSLLMIHSAGGFCMGNARDMRQTADTLDTFSGTMKALLEETTEMEQAKIEELYNYEDHWIDGNKAVEMGLVAQLDSSYSAEPIVEDPTKLSLASLIDKYQENQKPEGKPSFWQGILAKAGISTNEDSSQKSTDMNVEEFKNSIGKELPINEVIKHLQDSGHLAKAEPVAEPNPAQQDDVVKALQSEIDVLKTAVNELLKKPGFEGVVKTTADADPKLGVDIEAPSVEEEYRKQMKEFAEAAQSNINPFVGQ